VGELIGYGFSFSAGACSTELFGGAGIVCGHEPFAKLRFGGIGNLLSLELSQAPELAKQTDDRC
jgi:hypothetical protein